MAELHCPSCQNTLEEVSLYQTIVAGCRACGGMWFDHAATQILAQARLHPSFMNVVDGFDASTVTEPPARREPSYRDPAEGQRSCPECQLPLEQTDASNDVRVDVCDSHGVFFDRHEVRAMHGTLRLRAKKAAPVAATSARPAEAQGPEPAANDSKLSALDVVGSLLDVLSIFG